MELRYELYVTDRVASKPGKVVRTVHEEAGDDQFVELPSGWEDMTEDQLRRWGIQVRAERRKTQGAPHWSPRCRKPGCDERHEHALSEPREEEGWVVPERVILPLNGTMGCPCCGESVQSLDWDDYDGYTCTGCGFAPSDGYTLLATEPAPAVRWGTMSAMTPYRDAERAASAVTYHDGEPVVPDTGPVTGWDYPAGWDYPVVARTGKPVDYKVGHQRKVRALLP